MTSADIEMALCGLLGRTGDKILVPNVSWGLLNHECDILVVDKNNYAHEIEIKISRADLKRDLSKTHGHRHHLLRTLCFAIPESLLYCIELIPEHAGIYVVAESQGLGGEFYYSARLHRKPKINKNTNTLTLPQIRKVAYLSQFRTWKQRRINKELNLKIKSLTKGERLI